MEVRITKIDIDGEDFTAAITIQGLAKGIKVFDHAYDLARTIEREIAKQLTEEYLRKHTHEIMASVDKQQILNMIVLGAAKRFTQE